MLKCWMELKLKHCMNSFTQAQKRARRFNEDEAVWRSYEHRRALRRLLGSETPLPEETLDWLDWQAAERECREVRALGFFTHEDHDTQKAD